MLQSDANMAGHARLGLVVGKKAAKRAVKRNYMKRVIREWFRCRRHSLPPRDYIVRVRTAFGREDCAEACRELAALMPPHPNGSGGKAA